MKILDSRLLGQSRGIRLSELVIASPDIARAARAGQFVAIMVNSAGERIPLTIVEADSNNGTIRIIFQEAGFTTKLLGTLKKGAELFAVSGPLGHPTEIKKYGKVILVGGGVGIAEILPVAKALKNAGNKITTILGARNKELLILENELSSYSDAIEIVTDDGSYGKKGFTTDVLTGLLKAGKYDLVYAVGPILMMKTVSGITKTSGVKTIVSLNALMVDATGMCGCCRVTVGGELKFSCVDGPEFEASSVDWDELVNRSRIYLDKENHICNLGKTG